MKPLLMPVRTNWLTEILPIFICIGIDETILPSHVSGRILFLTCALFGYLVLASYTSTLSATLIIQKSTEPYNSLLES